MFKTFNQNFMKQRLYLLLLLLILTGSCQDAFAGFAVRKSSIHSVNQGAVSGITSVAGSRLTEAKQSMLQKLARPYMPYNRYRQNQWYGIASMVAATLGLFIPGVYLLAILFGVLGMGRKCRAQGLAVAGFVIGMLELALFLITSSVFLSLILF